MTAFTDAVAALRRGIDGRSIADLFAADPDRASQFSARLDDLTLDYSKERIDPAGRAGLLALADTAGVAAARDALFAGAAWNVTENRPALHMALRDSCRPDQPGVDEIAATRDRFLGFAEAVRDGRYRPGAAPVRDVINIGIGGSDLGPAMATRALAPDHDGPRLHFVANVDGADLADTLRRLDPAGTLVLIASKTFTTLETMTNARSALGWLTAAVGDRAPAHLAAVSSNPAGCAAFGIPPDRVFGFRDWVGGRYSIWSAIGLPLAIAIGADRFRQFLAGAAALDRHFRTAPWHANLPVLLALIGIWRRNVLGCPTVAMIPYDHRLQRFVAYVQQLDMESNGKRVTRGGTPAATATGPVIWGEPGSNAQHSFFQLLHQGTDIVPVDFIAAALPRDADPAHHRILLANCLAQGQALAFGKTEAEEPADRAATTAPDIDRLAPHRAFPGNRPSTTLLFRQLDPFALGRLIALFEHKVFVQSVIWDINPFDQWGVELGKLLAHRLLPVVAGTAPVPDDLDPSTAGLAVRLRELQA